MSTTSETGPEHTPAGPGGAASDAAAREREQDRELGEAGSQLSTAPKEDLPNLPALGVVGWARWFWRQLTSMRVALLLLLLLSLAAIPGSLIPQTGVDETRVADFREQHEFLAPLYDKLGMFNVYGSVWFSAIYILLFISLIGCIAPRTWQFVGQLRGRPPGAPKRLTRLPAYTTWRTEADPEQVREAALALLRKRRFRAHLAGDAVAAEKGYLREAGNLAFHLALIVMLIAFAWGQLFKSEGNKLIVEGNGFANTLTQYDDFKSGNLFDVADLEPFSFDVKSFTGTYERSGPNKGTPRTYETELVYTEGAYGEEKTTTVKVNEPLVIGDAKVYLVSHGYAPVVTVRDGDGKVVFKDAVPLLPLDSNVTSSGVVKVLDGYRNAQGEKEQLGFNAFFVPTFGGSESGTMLSQFPGLDYPVLALSAYHGDLKADSGIPQSVYQMDKTKMKEFKDSDGELFKKMLTPGETMTLPGGAGTVTFEKEVREWAGFQMVQEPGGGWALGGSIVAIAGLAGSLFIQRRRVWVRAVEGPDGVTVVEMAGLGRSESATVPEELGDLAGILYDRAPGAPDTPEPESSAASPAPSEPSGSPGSPDSPDPQAVPAEGAEKP
ncbi:cytochrome c biogenesis protein ResB [Streptomyces prasinus]|uniref:Cytochrome c biogenesis protein ResB n=1 Tax=Streptomyces prasinus TaxID=67345 RepID=A0ABX6AY79_9ACTN|nr:cytochrome c biogenesis protein ResB [Streptomyces prasinus]QEV07717.1 cytochrome c biogenesis protein ResB [Streptomyces prasinus]